MPKTIEQLNAEFEARMEKAKQDELNAAAEKAAAEIKAAEEARKAEEARAAAEAKAAAEARAAAEAKAAEEARRVEERSYDSVIDNSVISANELEPVEDDFEETYSGEEEVSVEESEPEVKEGPVEKQTAQEPLRGDSIQGRAEVRLRAHLGLFGCDAPKRLQAAER